MTSAMAATGTQVLGGRYALQEVLGIGGMATVWRATDDVLGRAVAVKVLSAQYAADSGFLARFSREAKNVAALTSSRIVTVFDYGVDGSAPYIVMELVSGRTLRQLLDESGTLPPAEAVRIAAAVCEALEAAHAAGLVHRDIKPANIVLSGREVKVLDFGIATARLRAGQTKTNGVLGTAAYLSPEQASGSAVGPRSDLYSLGCVLVEMLTGEPPFPADSEVAVAYRQVHDDPEPPSARRPELSAQLDWITTSLLAKKPEDRPVGAAAAREGLLAALAPDQTALLDVTPASRVRRSPPGRPFGWRPSETVLAMALIAALAALAIVLVTGSARSVAAGSVPPTPQPSSSSYTTHQTAPPTTTSGQPPLRRVGGLPPAAVAAGDVVTELQAGMTDGQVSQQAGQSLFNQLQQVLFNTPRSDAEQVEQQYAQLVEGFDQYRAAGQITGQAALALQQDIDALGLALGAG
jgi:eukaryotic-like serine/threonine-protein kinase